ncbi:MAG: tetratricopeptide repeat protein [Bryobacterales bacterium]|nr:tetratricopeptide repeat protein [Bryobacterales bacterium]
MKGRHQQTRRTPEGLHKSIANFHEAIALDPAFAAAYCGLSESYSIMAYNELLPPRELMPKAKAAAQHVAALDETLGTAHALLGDVLSVYEWDWEGGEKEFRRATQLNPGDALAHYLYATSNLGPRARWQEALEEMHRALQLDPVSPAMNRDLGQLLFMQRNYDQAIEQFHRTRDLDPDFIGVYYWLGRAYEQKNMPVQALAAFEQRLLRSKNTRVLAAIAHLHAASGNRAEALARLKELQESPAAGRVPALDLAAVYVGLGETDRALEFLEHAFEERSAAIYQLKVDPVYDPLRGKAGFTTLLKKMGLDR